MTANGRTTASYVTKLDDGRIMTLSYPKYVDTASDEFYGPISFTVANQAGRVEAQGLIELNDNSGVYTTDAQTAHVDETDSDPLQAIETVSGIGTIVRYSVNVYNDSGMQLTETRSYFDIPASGAGSEGTNYDATFFAYDDMGRRIRTKDATGTIQRTVYDVRGGVSSQWIGTNDNGEEGGETSGTNDMVKISENTYDGGSDEGNSLLTKMTRFIDGTTTDRRETHFTHDFQGRVIVQTKKDDGGNKVGPQTLNKYDNMGRLIASGTYSSGATLAITDDPTSVATNRLALSQTFYDEMGRVWKTQRHKIDPSDGSDDGNLTSLTWYDEDGRVIKVDGEQLTKTVYDRLGRTTHQFILASTDDGATTYADADDVSGDIVLEEHQTTYDPTTGEVIMTAVIERFHDDYGASETTGALDTNADTDSLMYTAANLEGRIQIATTYDSLGRRQLVTQYNNATVGSGTVVDEVKFSYDEWGNLASFDQDHNSTVATGGTYLYGIDYAYETAGSGTENGRNTLRRTQLTMTNGAYVLYDYSSTHGFHDEWMSRPTSVKIDADGSGGGSAVTVATYSYNGSGHVVSTDYAEPDVMSLAYAIGSPNAYGNLDRFNRVITSQWTKDLATDHNFFDVDVFYDRASNITWLDDTVLGGWDYEFTIDGLNRLTQAERGTASGGPPPTTLSSLTFDQQWTLDQVGNWDHTKLDLNGNAAFTDKDEYDDDRTHNDVNELTARDTDDNGTDNFTLTYFKTGALKNDGENYKYVWDAWGRLKEVLDRSDDSLVAEYTYNGLGFRISEHHDTDNDGDVDGSDATYHFVFDERWRIVATYRNDDANPKEQFVYHCAGAGGYGGSSYIDAVILRDVDLSTAWNAQADALDARHYYCQNWRADVSVIIDDSAVLVERIMYSPYGVPFGIPVGDLVGTGGSEPADGTIGTADSTALSGTYWGSSYNIADLDNDGDVDSADQTIQSNNNGATIGWTFLSDTHNRLGYAGYVFDEALAGTKWHVRHRVLESVLGRWIGRDPLGYVDGLGLSAYCKSGPVRHRDADGRHAGPIIISAQLGCELARASIYASLSASCKDKLDEGNPNPTTCKLASQDNGCKVGCEQYDAYGFTRCGAGFDFPYQCCICDDKLFVEAPLQEVLLLWQECVEDEEARQLQIPCCVKPCVQCYNDCKTDECLKKAHAKCMTQECREFFIEEMQRKWEYWRSDCQKACFKTDEDSR